MKKSVLLALLLVVTACGTTSPPPREPRDPHTPVQPGLPSPDLSGSVPAPPPGTDPDPGPPRKVTNHPRLVFSAPGHHYGSMEKHARKSHTAVFYNGGAKPLEIRKINTHCGCAAALLSTKVVPPGDKGTIKITMDSGTLPGRRTKTVEVFTNDPEKPVSKYVISCDTIADVGMDPLVLVLRATRSAGEVSAHFDVKVLQPGFKLKITKLEPSNPDMKTSLSPLPAGSGKTGFRVDIVFGPSFGSGDFKERVVVHTNSKRDPRLVMDIFGSVRQAVLVVPERLYFPRLKPGEMVSRILYLSREDGKSFAVTGVEDPAGIFETSTKRVSDARWEVRLDISGEAPKDTVRGTVVVLTNEPSDPRVAVPYEIPGEED